MKKCLLFSICLIFLASSAFAFPPFKIADDKWLKIFYDAQFGYTYRDMGSGSDNEKDTHEFNFRRNRLGFVGTYNRNLSFYFQVEYIEDREIGSISNVDVSDGDHDFYVLDAQIRYKFTNGFQIWAGKLKHNLTRENLEGCFEPLTMDRSNFVYTPFKTSRDKGVAVWGNILNNKVVYKFDIMEGQKGDNAPESNFRYTGRLHYSFLDPETDYGYKGTYLGEKNVLTIGASVQYEPDAVYSDVRNHRGKKDYFAYSVDLFYEQPSQYGTFTISAAYLDIDLDNAYKGVNPDDEITGLNGEKNGYYVKGAYMLPMNIGPGKLQFFARYDGFSFGKLENTYDQDVSWFGVGFNYYIFGQDLKITGEYSHTNFDKEDPNDPNYQDFNTFRLFVQVRI